MKRAAIIGAAVVVVALGYAAADWYVLGGPIANRAIALCEGDQYEPVPKSEREDFQKAKYDAFTGRDEYSYAEKAEWPKIRKRVGHKRAQKRCSRAYRRGTLTIRGGIT